MLFTQETEDFAAAPQICPEDVPAIAASGFRSILCNRPDGESPDQTPVAAIAEAAEAHGLAFAHVPVISGAITPEDVARFCAARAALPAPVFAYCRSGTRCRALVALAGQSGGPGM